MRKKRGIELRKVRRKRKCPILREKKQCVNRNDSAILHRQGFLTSAKTFQASLTCVEHASVCMPVFLCLKKKKKHRKFSFVCVACQVINAVKVSKRKAWLQQKQERAKFFPCQQVKHCAFVSANFCIVRRGHE